MNYSDHPRPTLYQRRMGFIFQSRSLNTNGTHLGNRKRFTNIDNRLLAGDREGDGGMGEDWIQSLGLEDAVFYIEWINDKVSLYSTENHIQYPVINHNGQNIKKSIYTCN